LASHGIDRDHTAFDGHQVKEVRNRRDLVRLLIRFDLASNEATLLGTPRRQVLSSC
jgi:hypothetical protein